MRLNAKQIADYAGGTFAVRPIDASAIMSGLTWDSRDVQPGWLYVALPGERVDGHDFVAAALRAGAWGAWSPVRSTRPPERSPPRWAPPSSRCRTPLRP